MTIKCQWCKKPLPPIAEWEKGRRDYFKASGRAYCGKECSGKYRAKRSSATMAATNRKYASERMRERNPMRHAAVRERVRTSLRAMGWKPPVRGGNGHPPTAPQLALAAALGWKMEVAVPTKMPRESGYPTCYKLDIANVVLKVGVEVDGFGHQSLKVQAKDAKKEKFLTSIGWTLLRFSNRQVTEHLAECVQTVLSTISK